MSTNLCEENLREAASIGDYDAVKNLLARNIDINSQNNINGWSALHWACKRGHKDVVKLLLDHGADPRIENFKGEVPVAISTDVAVVDILRNADPQLNHVPVHKEDNGLKFIPNYIRNPVLNGNIDVGHTTRHTDFINMPTTSLPAQNDELILKVRIAASLDPDFIEIEIPKWKLTYSNLMKICCEELEISEVQVERIRKLPNTRLRKDSDVKRLIDLQCLEIVLKTNTEKYNNGYQSISACKDQKILY